MISNFSFSSEITDDSFLKVVLKISSLILLLAKDTISMSMGVVLSPMITIQFASFESHEDIKYVCISYQRKNYNMNNTKKNFKYFYNL